MFQGFVSKLDESLTLLMVLFLGVLASVLSTDGHTMKSVIAGVVFAGFVGYMVNLALLGVPAIDDNQRAVVVGVSTYLNRYILDMLNALGESLSTDPKGALKSMKDIWKSK